MNTMRKSSYQCIEQKAGTFLVDARLELQDFFSQTGIDLLEGASTDEYDTIGGFVFNLI